MSKRYVRSNPEESPTDEPEPTGLDFLSQTPPLSCDRLRKRSPNILLTAAIAFGVVFVMCSGIMAYLVATAPERRAAWEVYDKERHRAVAEKANQDAKELARTEVKKKKDAAAQAVLLEKYRTAIEVTDRQRVLIADVSQGYSDNQVKVTVTDAWHRLPYQIRLQTAQRLSKLWENTRSPKIATITIRDGMGNEVGGTGLTGFWVQKE